MAIEHDSIPNADIHEPKGASTATEGTVYISDGAGSGAWRHHPHVHIYYSNIGTGTTVTTPTSYTLINPTTTGDATPRDFTQNSAGRITYTGTTTMDVAISANIVFKHSTGTGQDCYFQIHKNGSPLAGAEWVRTADSGNYGEIAILGHGEMATNDYFEVYCKVSTGDIVVHAMAISAHGAI